MDILSPSHTKEVNSDCSDRGRQCSYQRLCEIPGNPPSSLQRGSRHIPETDADIDDMPESTWDLGLQTFYPSTRASYNR
ncbi:hypothetical protein N7510_005727 [Penicillium lagena]|uniref:uncharacterized protein n=1 Tax=Penicillium lagena TaxID=94218 RepID=UPI00253F9366|nr:uncharacterized protein N7510_005727 [Penicillium lagena]KAJ5612533.1 hypothetical protein N7510_005727 [Penicillium lagena]